ncbi:MAG TPA: ATP-binding protein [Actinocrinis sp.]|uniref:ATP-binding protein n=1 Tax=Actinocrinis sp. TaxID=1920516 RepID=UPI002DDD3CAD|nr:ATP-binding protein [Actinocrinis sp.]HEV3170075.1 ATP-binding protein [Actinocrinis sp.]
MPEPPLTRSVHLAAEVTAPRSARDFLAAACSAWHTEWLSATAGLALSELVSNAVLHAGTDLDVELRLGDGWLRLSVHDGSPVLPLPRQHEPGAFGGHGLDFVSRLADSWGVAPGPDGGKTVWCALRADKR